MNKRRLYTRADYVNWDLFKMGQRETVSDQGYRNRPVNARDRSRDNLIDNNGRVLAEKRIRDDEDSSHHVNLLPVLCVSLSIATKLNHLLENYGSRPYYSLYFGCGFISIKMRGCSDPVLKSDCEHVCVRYNFRARRSAWEKQFNLSSWRRYSCLSGKLSSHPALMDRATVKLSRSEAIWCAGRSE